MGAADVGGAGHFLDPHSRIDAVLIEQVDIVGAKPWVRSPSRPHEWISVSRSLPSVRLKQKDGTRMNPNFKLCTFLIKKIGDAHR